jgi:NADH dehydrogenase
MVSHIRRGLEATPLVGIFPTVGIFQKSMRPVSVDDVVKVLMAALVDNRLSRQTVAVVGPEEMSLGKAVQRVAKVMHKWAITLPMPALAHYAVASSMERTMKEPLVSIAQIRMIAEGMSQALPNTDLLPSDLQPQTKFTEEEIRAALGLPALP